MSGLSRFFGFRDVRFLFLTLVIFFTLLMGIAGGFFYFQHLPYVGLDLAGTMGHVRKVIEGGPAEQAGLLEGDVILALDGVPLNRNLTFYRDNTFGDTLEVEVLRNSQVLVLDMIPGRLSEYELILRIERFSVGIIFLITALGLWVVHYSSRVTQRFLIICLVMSSMLFADVMDPDIPWFAVFSDFLIIMVGPLALHLFSTFPSPLSPRGREPLLRVVNGMCIVLLLVFIALLFVPVDRTFPMWKVDRVYLIVTILTALVVLFIPLGATSLQARRRRRLIVVGLLIGVSPVLCLTMIPELVLGEPFYAFTWTIPFLACVPVTYAYAVYSGELGQLDFFLNRSLFYVLLTACILGAYAIIFFVVEDIFSLEQTFWRIMVEAALFVAATAFFIRMRSRLQLVVDRLFYGSWFDYRTVVQAVSTELSRATTLRHLRVLLFRAGQTMNFQKGVLLWQRGTDFYPIGSYGFDQEVGDERAVSRNGELVKHLQERAQPCEREVLIKSLRDTPVTEAEQAMLNDPDFQVWVPLVCHGEIQSIIITGRQKGGERVDKEDLTILGTLMKHAALASENIILLDTLRSQLTELTQVKDDLAETKGRLFEGRETERLHLARELHDGPVQDLYTLSHQIETVHADHKDRTVTNELQNVQESVQQVARILRDICTELRPPLLVEFGLAAALDAHIERFRERYTDFVVISELMPDDQDLSEKDKLALFRIAQEALTNAAKHAGAGNVHIRYENDAEKTALHVWDDGCGFEVPDRWIELGRKGHLGLLGINERVEAIGGILEFVSSPGQGTSIRVTVTKDV